MQALLNDELIGEAITPNTIDALIEHQIITPRLTSANITFMQTFGILKQDISFKNDNLLLPSGESIPADLSTPEMKQRFMSKCLGDRLKNGKIVHAGFFFGSTDLYSALRNLSYEQAQCFEMTAIARTNALSWSPELLTLQRKHGRFVNTSLMVTATGVVISDGLTNYQELSGVGGQYDFVSMANLLEGAHSIINCRSTRESKHGVESNIIWDYANATIPRFLRDIVVTEYGIADCRSKTDSEIIKAMLNITDSRFQKALLQKAKTAGKLASDYEIPVLFQNNYPEALLKVISPFQKQGFCQPYPFGSDLTDDEQVIARVLLHLKNCSRMKLLKLVIASMLFFKSDAGFESYLHRMNLKSPKNVNDFIYKKLIKYLIHSMES